ncbi:MAG: exodeoxyribonuclease VII small subunit [Alphaproteobacteria bacterium]
MTNELSFEDAVKELESIVKQLESGDIKLDDAIKAYERGAELKNFCTKKLDEAMAKVEKINVADGKATTEEFQG